jgi:hypothetical protein
VGDGPYPMWDPILYPFWDQRIHMTHPTTLPYEVQQSFVRIELLDAICHEQPTLVMRVDQAPAKLFDPTFVVTVTNRTSDLSLCEPFSRDHLVPRPLETRLTLKSGLGLFEACLTCGIHATQRRVLPDSDSLSRIFWSFPPKILLRKKRVKGLGWNGANFLGDRLV